MCKGSSAPGRRTTFSGNRGMRSGRMGPKHMISEDGAGDPDQAETWQWKRLVADSVHHDYSRGRLDHCTEWLAFCAFIRCFNGARDTAVYGCVQRKDVRGRKWPDYRRRPK